MKLKDHFLTQEEFELKENTFGILETIPRLKVEDLAKYYQSENYISHTDSTKSVFDWIYQKAKNINLENKKRLIKKYKTSGEVLDYGCGTGDFIHYIKQDFNVQGIEPSEYAAEKAQKKSSLKITTNTDLSKFKDNTFDMITLWHVFEHVHDLKNISIELNRILKNDGFLVIAVPNHKSYDAQYYQNFWAAYDVPRHLWHFSKTAMKKWWIQFEMQIIDISFMKLDAFYISVLSEQYRNKTIFNFIKGIFRGFLSNQKAKKTGEYSSLVYILKKNLK
ncbi:MAG: class I SAM-dependent methyltransferase [Flavobacteriales bacterium]